MGPIPLSTYSYMAYLQDRTFTAPQGADRTETQTEAWDPCCAFPLCSFPLASSFHYLLPHPHQAASTLPWAEGLFQLLFKLRSNSSSAVNALQLRRARYTSRVWVLLLKRCSTYIIKSTLLSFAALPKVGSVCF